MRGFFAFTKKEFREHFRTYRIIILAAVFFVFGMFSPLTAKMLPEIFSSLDMQGIVINIPEPTYLDAYSQFFKNMTQIGLIVVLLVFSGMITNELTKGTLVIILSKGLPRHTVILSKYLVAVILWTISYAAAAVLNHVYTVYLFNQVSGEGVLFSLFCLWLFGVFMLAVIILASTITQGNYGGLLLSAGILILLMVLNMFPKCQRFNPVSLAANNAGLIANTVSVSDLVPTVWITVGLTALGILLSIFIFQEKQL